MWFSFSFFLLGLEMVFFFFCCINGQKEKKSNGFCISYFRKKNDLMIMKFNDFEHHRWSLGITI